MPRLTDLAIARLPTPEKGQKLHYDTLTGFGVRVSQGGTKTFVLEHGANRQKTSLGRVGVVSLQEARGEAKRLLAEQTLTKHRPTRLKAAEAVRTFLNTHVATNNKPSTLKSTKRRLENHLLPVVQGKFLEDIAPADITGIIDKITARGTPGEANHAYVVIRTFFNWCVKRHYLISSPCKGGLPAKRPPRTRLLHASEFVAIWRACDGLYGKLVQLLFTTGQRLNQVASLRAEYIQGDIIIFPPEVMKNSTQHIVPIGHLTKRILSTLPSQGLLFPARGKDTPFNGFSKSKNALDRRCPLDHWTLHDARRFHSSTHAMLGTPLHLEERLLAHASGVISGISAIYNRYDFKEQLVDAVKVYERHINGLLDDPCI